MENRGLPISLLVSLLGVPAADIDADLDLHASSALASLPNITVFGAILPSLPPVSLAIFELPSSSYASALPAVRLLLEELTTRQYVERCSRSSHCR